MPFPFVVLETHVESDLETSIYSPPPGTPSSEMNVRAAVPLDRGSCNYSSLVPGGKGKPTTIDNRTQSAVCTVMRPLLWRGKAHHTVKKLGINMFSRVLARKNYHSGC